MQKVLEGSHPLNARIWEDIWLFDTDSEEARVTIHAMISARRAVVEEMECLERWWNGLAALGLSPSDTEFASYSVYHEHLQVLALSQDPPRAIMRRFTGL